MPTPRTIPPFESNVSSKFGAPMGRYEDPIESMKGRVHLQRVPLFDGGCYDKGGAYWGSPANLWCAWNDEGVTYFRSSLNRENVKKMLPNCSFYR